MNQHPMTPPPHHEPPHPGGAQPAPLQAPAGVAAAASRSAVTSVPTRKPTTFADTVRSEWIKLASLRSAWIVPIAGALLPVVVMGLVATFASTENSDVVGLLLGMLYIPMVAVNAFCATGVTSEYNHDTIRITYAATPQRGRVIAAKYLVLVGYSVTALIAISALSIAVGALVLTIRGSSDPMAGAPVLNLAWALLVAALMCAASLALGYLIRNSAAAVTIAAVYPFVTPIIAGILFGTGNESLVKWMPFVGAWNAATAEDEVTGGSLGRPWAFIYLLGFVAAFSVLSIVVERRRDV